MNDILLVPKKDRRKLANVPDQKNKRAQYDRRMVMEQNGDGKAEKIAQCMRDGIRYEVNYRVEIRIRRKKSRTKKYVTTGTDISTTGILLEIREENILEEIKRAESVVLRFEILPGTMPEGYEMNVKIAAHLVRYFTRPDGVCVAAFNFEDTLSRYSFVKKDAAMLSVASALIFVIFFFVMLMRAESVIYFKFNRWLYLYSIIAASFLLSRYLLGAFYHPVRVDLSYEPGVTIVIPCFNEETWIERTIVSCMNQDYPPEKLEVIIVDDCSNDHSAEKIVETVKKLMNGKMKDVVGERIRFIIQSDNKGKREALCEGVKRAKHELVVFVDSDSFLDPFAIRNLVQPFRDPKTGGVAGRTDVANTYTNVLTKMQSVRYYIAFRVMKAAEACFDTVTCLSGPISCYRKEIVIENMKRWREQRFLGQRATFGDDRALTNIVLEKYRTFYQDTAVCSTIVPNKHSVFLKQQMRWKRSWLRESIIAGKFMWRKEPLAAVSFYIGLFIPVAAPVVVLYNLVYVPAMHHIFPMTFLVGLFLMSGLMSVAQLFFRKSSTWFYGFVFCLYYELILLWQMPVAWFTFWKSTWGTRMTPADLAALEKRKKRREQT